MSNKLFYSSPRARFADTNYNPLTFGRVSFYEAGTTTLKEIYTDSENTTQLPNPFLLDAEGYVPDGGVWMGAGRYKMKLEEALVIPPDILEDGDFSELWTIDNIQGATSLNSGQLETIVVATIADLKGLTAGEYSLVYVAGYWKVNDGGGGWFNYDANDIQADNGGTVISPDGAPAIGRYLRNIENWETSVQYFGATSSSFILNANVVDSYVQNCLTWCLANAQTMVFPSDTYTFGSTQTYQGDLTIRVKENAVFRSELAIEIHLEPQNLEVEGVTNHLGDNIVLYLAPVTPNSFRPEHWGAVGGTDNDLDWQGFVNADGRYSDSTLILSANYQPFIPVGNPTSSFAIQKAHLLKGGSLDTDATVSIGDYTFENETNTFWLFDIINLGAYSMRTIYLDHFKNFAGLSDANFAVLADAVTNTNTRHGTMQLLSGGTYQIVGISELANYSLDLYIKTGNIIKANGASNLPRLLNNIGDFGILDNSGDTIKLQGDKHSVLWWGASSSTDTATTNLGITQAIASASLDGSNRGWVTGNNEALSLTSVNLAINNPFVEIVDLKITTTAGFITAFLGGSIKCFNCYFTGLGGTVGGSYSFDSCEVSGTTGIDISASVVEVSRCNFTMNSSTTLKLNATQELYYEGNRSSSGRFDFTTGSSTNVISNNRFNGLVRVGTGNQSFLIVRGGSYTALNSNVMKGVGIYAGGGIAYFVNMIGTGGITGFVSESNTFTTDTGLGSDWSSYLASGYSTTGHFARVRNNAFTSSVEEVGTFVDFSNSNCLTATYIKTFTGIFPNTTYPSVFWSSSDYIDAPYLDQTITTTLVGGMMTYEMKLFSLQTGAPRRLNVGLSANCETEAT